MFYLCRAFLLNKVQAHRVKKAQTDIAELHYDPEESILYISIFEGAEMNLEVTKFHYKIIAELTENKPHAVLLDASVYFSVDKESMEFTSQAETMSKRIATAHFDPNIANDITVNFFKARFKPPGPVKIFKTKPEALLWLKEQISTYFE